MRKGKETNTIKKMKTRRIKRDGHWRYFAKGLINKPDSLAIKLLFELY